MTVKYEITKERMAPAERPLRLALVSCGLGNVKRGFEVSTDRWYRTLKDTPGLDVKLFCGGFHPGGKFVLNIPRDWVMMSPLSVLSAVNRRRFWEFCYGVEQVSFGLFYWPELALFKPDIVWTKEVPFGYFLPIYKKALGLNFKTVFANGGAFRPSTYKDFDYIQHLAPNSFDEALDFGIPAEKMTTLTNAVMFKEPRETREQLREEFGYANDDFVVMTASAWNAYHKRIDYLINEVAAIDDPKVKLLLCGHPDAETTVLKELAQEKLGDRVKWMTLPEDKVPRAMKMADVFALGSLHESLGNVIPEAVMAGLPIVMNVCSSSKFIFGEKTEWAIDASTPNNMRDRLMQLRADQRARARMEEERPRVIQQFSPESLAPRFLQMARSICGR